MTSSKEAELTAEAVADPALAAVDGRRGGRLAGPRRRRRRQPVKRSVVTAHRWLSLVLGLVLLLITTTGAAAVYAPEWTRWSNPSVFHVTHSTDEVTFPEAIQIVNRAHPSFHAGSVVAYSGLDEVESIDSEAHPGFYGVDPGSGRITGHADPDRGFMAFMLQAHECLFSCAGETGYLSWMAHPMPTLGMHWLQDVTVAGFILGIFGLLLLFLAVSGIWLWWPTLKRFGDGFRVRTGKGRYARDYDLHQVIGMIAVPFLLVWGLTGASFEFHWVNTAWYAVTGGQQPTDDTFASRPVKGKVADITPAQATVAAQRAAGHKRITNLFAPDPGDPTSPYIFYFSSGLDPARHASSPGEFEVQVDRHDASRVDVHDYGTAPTTSNKILDVWGSQLGHYGQTLNGWWRLIWFLCGLAPLLLAITGMSTWLAKRAVKKRRRQALAAAAATRAAATTSAGVTADPAAGVAPA